MHRHGVDYVVISPGSRSAALAMLSTTIRESRPGSSSTNAPRPFMPWASRVTRLGGRTGHVGDGARQLPPGGDRGRPVAHPSNPDLGRPAARAPPRRRQPDHRPSRHIRGKSPLVVCDPHRRARSRLQRLLALDGFPDHGAGEGAQARPGPVHLNVAFREPTVPVSDDGRTRAEPYRYPIDGRAR